jgi:hypothetical protein
MTTTVCPSSSGSRPVDAAVAAMIPPVGRREIAKWCSLS